MIGTQMRPFNDYIIGTQYILPTIKFFIERSPTKEEKMPFEDMVKIMGEKIENFDNDTLESIVCGTSQALFQQGISTKINIGKLASNYCIYFTFRYSTPEDILPTLETCDTNWNNLIELHAK